MKQLMNNYFIVQILNKFGEISVILLHIYIYTNIYTFSTQIQIKGIEILRE